MEANTPFAYILSNSLLSGSSNQFLLSQPLITTVLAEALNNKRIQYLTVDVPNSDWQEL